MCVDRTVLANESPSTVKIIAEDCCEKFGVENKMQKIKRRNNLFLKEIILLFILPPV
jgi:hypothetical protein